MTCAAVLENRSIMFIIEVCFVADMSPAMPSVILDANKEARRKHSAAGGRCGVFTEARAL